MLARQRQERILEEVRARGGARVSDLVAALGVSEMTVRRDITILAGQGLVARVHGGAAATSALSARAEEPGFGVKSQVAREQKEAIARAAVALLEPGASLAVSAGTTTHAVALVLARTPLSSGAPAPSSGASGPSLVVTNSLPVAQVLHEAWPPGGCPGGCPVVLTGGERTRSDALVGPVATAALQSLHVDTLLLGAHGVDPGAGLTTPNLVEAQTNRALVAAARQVVVVADSSKWGVVGLAGIAGLEEVDVLVTDDGISAQARAVLAERVGRLVVAGETSS